MTTIILALLNIAVITLAIIALGQRKQIKVYKNTCNAFNKQILESNTAMEALMQKVEGQKAIESALRKHLENSERDKNTLEKLLRQKK